MTKYQTYSENAQEMGNFQKYAKENHASWVEFASNAGHGDVNPVLVTGVDRTKDFAMMCYSDCGSGLECEFITSTPGITSASAWGTWRASRPIYMNHGPQPSSLPPVKTADTMSPGNTHAETVSDEFTQCVFIRYFSMLPRKEGVPKVIKAEAPGPHDVNTEGYDGEGPPPQVQRDSGLGSEISSSSLENCTGANVDSKSDAVMRNPSTVHYLLPSSFRLF